MTIIEFLVDRIAEDALVATRYHRLLCLRLDYSEDELGQCTCGHPERILAECRAKQALIKLHERWPVLLEKAATYNSGIDPADPMSMVITVSQELTWLTTREYRKRFGDDPPTAPFIREMAAIYAAHPDYQKEWKP